MASLHPDSASREIGLELGVASTLRRRFDRRRLHLRPYPRNPLGLQSEGRVAVGDQKEGVGSDAVVPADHALDELEEGARIATGD
jgi:hypothetical protein